MDTPRRSARIAAKPIVSYVEPDYADLNEYQRETIDQMLHGAPSYTASVCAGLFSLTVVAFTVAFVAATSYNGVGTYSELF
jgi:hypothetical protein